MVFPVIFPTSITLPTNFFKIDFVGFEKVSDFTIRTIRSLNIFNSLFPFQKSIDKESERGGNYYSNKRYKKFIKIFHRITPVFSFAEFNYRSIGAKSQYLALQTLGERKITMGDALHTSLA